MHSTSTYTEGRAGSHEHLSHTLQTCPQRALRVLEPFANVGPRALDRMIAFWAALDQAMDAWLVSHPEWGEILRGWIESTHEPETRQMYEDALARYEARPSSSQDELAELEREQRHYCDANHRLDADLTPHLDLTSKRACYLLRLEMIEAGIQDAQRRGLIELTTWRSTVAEHLHKQLRQTEHVMMAY